MNKYKNDNSNINDNIIDSSKNTNSNHIDNNTNVSEYYNNSNSNEPDDRIIEYFKADIAGRHIEIECNHRYVFNMSGDYLARFEKPDLVIGVSQDEIEQERINSAEQDRAEGHNVRHYSDAYLESLAVYRKMADTLLEDGIMLFHGAAIAVEDKCYLFMAKSGTGKTTHIRKWLRMYPDSFVVNGDKPLIDMNKLLVYGTPWCGKENMNTNTAVELGGLIWLERGEKNEIEQLKFTEILPCLMQQCHIPNGTTPSGKPSLAVVMQLISKMQEVPCWRLRCNIEDEAAEISYAAVTRMLTSEAGR